MDRQLYLAPFGYLVIDRELRILDINKKMMMMTGINKVPDYLHEMLTISSLIYFQTYFIPVILTQGTISEMSLKLKNPSGAVPVLMNAEENNGLYGCAFMQVSLRNAYENELLSAKRDAERISQATEKAHQQLLVLLNEVESKQAELGLLNSRLTELTITDVLTKLKNRRYLEEFVPPLIKEGTLSIMLIDIDFFKKINDTFGHYAGDVVLQELAHVLESSIDDPGFAIRIGGEEFVVVLPETGQYAAEGIAEKVRRSVEVAHWSYGQITVSIGLAESTPDMTLSSLLKAADIALYNSKIEGRNRITIAKP